MHIKRILKNNKILLIILIISLILRFTWLYTHIEMDEGSFGYFAWRWLRDVRLPEQAYANKPPLIYIAYAISIKIFGNTIIPIRVFNNILFLFSILILYKLTSDWYGKRVALISIAFYGFFMNVPVFEGYYAFIESFLAPLTILLIYLLWYYYKTNKTIFLFLSAFILFICIGFKQTSLILILLIPFTIFVTKKKSTQKYKDIIFFSAFLFLLILISLLPLIKYVNLPAFFEKIVFSYENYFIYRSKIDYYTPIITEGVSLFIGSLIGLSIIIKRKEYHNRLLLLWFILQFIVVIFPPMFRHYFPIIILPGSIICGIGLNSLINFKTNKSKLFLIVFMLITFYSLSFQIQHFYEYNFQPNLRFDGGNSYKEQIQVADFINRNTNKNESILIWDNSETIHWLSERLPPYFFSKEYLTSRYHCELFNMMAASWNISIDFLRESDLFYIIENYNELKYIIFFPKYPRKCIMFDKILFAEFTDNESMIKIGPVEIYPLRNLTFTDLFHYCSLINVTDVEDECYLRLAQSARNLSYCEQIRNQSKKQKCQKTTD